MHNKKPDKIGYYSMIRARNKILPLRKNLVNVALKQGIKPTAHDWGTTHKTLRKWLRRYQQRGNPGFEEAPLERENTPPHKDSCVHRATGVRTAQKDPRIWLEAPIFFNYNKANQLRHPTLIWDIRGGLTSCSTYAYTKQREITQRNPFLATQPL